MESIIREEIIEYMLKKKQSKTVWVHLREVNNTAVIEGPRPVVTGSRYGWAGRCDIHVAYEGVRPSAPPSTCKQSGKAMKSRKMSLVGYKIFYLIDRNMW